jgi:hypothetical protein
MRPHFNYRAMVTLDVRYGSKADIAAAFPDVRSTLERRSSRSRACFVAMCGVDFAAHIHKQYDEYGAAIREANIKAE